MQPFYTNGSMPKGTLLGPLLVSQSIFDGEVGRAGAWDRVVTI